MGYTWHTAGIGMEKSSSYRVEILFYEKQVEVKCGSIVLLVNKYGSVCHISDTVLHAGDTWTRDRDSALMGSDSGRKIYIK